MPTALTHALTGLAVGELLAPQPMTPVYHVVTVALSLLPDVDAIGFRLGIPYGSRYGHRGFSHSLLCATVAGLATALALASWLPASWTLLWGIFSSIIVLHSVQDALTDGGMGIAFFAPFDDGRYFFPWRPIRVSPIGMAVFSHWGFRALMSEVVWVWVPLAVFVACATSWRGWR